MEAIDDAPIELYRQRRATPLAADGDRGLHGRIFGRNVGFR
jgi:hypothetical protein